jgi:hypothetical protein
MDQKPNFYCYICNKLDKTCYAYTYYYNDGDKCHVCAICAMKLKQYMEECRNKWFEENKGPIDKDTRLKYVKILHDVTDIGLMDCKEALEEADGNFKEAFEILRRKFSPIGAKE